MRIDVAAQETALAQAKATLPPLQLQFEQTRDLIRALVGNLPNDDVPETFELDALRLPPDVPLSLPAKIIEQRPDVRSSEELLHSAADALVGHPGQPKRNGAGTVIHLEDRIELLPERFRVVHRRHSMKVCVSVSLITRKPSRT